MGINIFPKMYTYLSRYAASLLSRATYVMLFSLREGADSSLRRRYASRNGGRRGGGEGEKKESYFQPAHFSSVSVGIDGPPTDNPNIGAACVILVYKIRRAYYRRRVREIQRPSENSALWRYTAIPSPLPYYRL